MTIESVIKTQSTPTPSPLTGDEVFALGDIGSAELVKGELALMSPTGHYPGYCETNVATALTIFVRANKLGRVLGDEVGLYTGRNPDTVRAAEVAFISIERWAKAKSQSYLDVAPELIVAILSPDDRCYNNIQQKLQEYFEVDVKVVWIVDPILQQVHVYRSLMDIAIVGVDEALSLPDLLPSFTLPMADLFAE